MPKRPSGAGGMRTAAKKSRCADRGPTVESMLRDEIRKKIAHRCVSAQKYDAENYAGHTGQWERCWPLGAERGKCLRENARKNTISRRFKGDVRNPGKVGKLERGLEV